MRDRPRPGPTRARLGLGSDSARAQLERLGKWLGPCKGRGGLLREFAIWMCEFLQCTVLGKHGAVSDDVTLRGRDVIFFLKQKKDHLTLSLRSWHAPTGRE